MSKGTVLVAASNADRLQLKAGKSVSVGFYLNELVVPSMAAIEAGYEIVLATPRGTRPVLDERSRAASHFADSEKSLQNAVHFAERYPAMVNPKSLRGVIESGLEAYAGVFVPGGHAPIVDLMQDPALGEILRHCHERSKPTALLCHGPIAVAAAMTKAPEFRAAMVSGQPQAARAAAKDWPYSGYSMTIFSDEEEKVVEDRIFDGKLQFYVNDALEIAGGRLRTERPFQPNAVQDHELITGQNPASDHALAELFVKALLAAPPRAA